MKIIANRLRVLLCSLLLVTACKKEEKLTPSEGKENVYSDHTLPQGNHAYDATIVNLFQKYNTMFLYKYIPNDLYFNINTYFGGSYDAKKDSTTRGGYFDVPANEAYVGMQLDLIKELLLKYYSDDLLRQGLTQKVYLVDSFYFAYSGPGKPVDNWPFLYDVYEGGDYMLVAWGGTRLNTMTKEEKYSLKGQLNALFLSITHKRGVIKPTAAFATLTNYSSVTWNNYYPLGALDYYLINADKDWDLYVQAIVSNSYASLIAPGGILHAGVDTKGIIRKKYDLVIAYFKTVLGVDLQAIGDAGI